MPLRTPALPLHAAARAAPLRRTAGTSGVAAAAPAPTRLGHRLPASAGYGSAPLPARAGWALTDTAWPAWLAEAWSSACPARPLSGGLTLHCSVHCLAGLGPLHALRDAQYRASMAQYIASMAKKSWSSLEVPDPSSGRMRSTSSPSAFLAISSTCASHIHTSIAESIPWASTDMGVRFGTGKHEQTWRRAHCPCCLCEELVYAWICEYATLDARKREDA